MSNYLPSDGLKQSLKVSQMLSRPLLLTGEPGTGKTRFADYIRYEMEGDISYQALEKFYTKSTSLSQDLFYEFDAIAYFASKQLEEDKPITAFIQLRSLGKAICNGLGPKEVEIVLRDSVAYRSLNEDQQTAFVNAFISQMEPNRINSIVLIDEIDKAPRDFPNDVLNEIDEGYLFKIKEIDVEFRLAEKSNILIIITSNFEKNLPEPFLRRCVYFNIEFPTATDLLKIICKRLYPELYDLIGESEIKILAFQTKDVTLQKIINRVEEIMNYRDNRNIIKRPSTSEILDFFYCLKNTPEDQKPDLGDMISKEHLLISTLFKRKEDTAKI